MPLFERGLTDFEACVHAHDDPAGLNGQSCSDRGLIVRALPDGRAGRRARAIVREVLTEAGVREPEVADAELAVGELAANAETHSYGPYEMRIVLVDGHPAWCEVVDADEDLAGIPEMFAELRSNVVPDDLVSGEELPQENGHGLAIVHRLSGGRCEAFPAVLHTTGLPGKAVAFALPGSGDSTGGSPLSGHSNAARPNADFNRANRPARTT